MNISRVLKIIIKNLGYLSLYLLKLFIKKRNIVLLESTSHYRYGGNPKYIYEYLSKNISYDVYWLTESKKIKQYLDSKGFKYLSNSSFIYKFYTILRAKIIISSGTSFYDPFYFISRDKNLVKICTMHGSGPKLTIARKYNNKESLRIVKDINSFDYVSFCTEHASKIVGVNQLFLPLERIRLLGAPKNDVLFDVDYVNHNYNNRNLLKQIVNENINGKVIYYVPTYRPYKSKLPIKLLLGFDEEKFYNFLEDENIFFIYSDHPSSLFTSDLEENNRIIKINFEDNPLFDNIELMMETDILIGDYSTLSTDFSIMKRPQIFIMPDYVKHNKIKGMAEDIRSLLPGIEVETFDSLCLSIKKYLNNKNKFNDDYGDKIDKLHDRYVGQDLTESRKLFSEFIIDILENS